MSIVTFISDFGTTDYYSAVVKGALLTENAQLNLVDISHNVKPYDIVQGAFILKNTYSHFPSGTIHLISVNNFYRKDYCFLAIRYDDHYFIGPDNGLFALAFDKEKLTSVYELNYNYRNDNPLGDVFAQGVRHILSDLPFNEIGIPIEAIEERISIQPVTTKNQIRGSVIHIDNYENAITNISKELIEKVGQDRKFKVRFKRHEPLNKIHSNYAETPVGEILCLVNSANYLEIAINLGRAASMLGLNVDEQVQIDFEEE